MRVDEMGSDTSFSSRLMKASCIAISAMQNLILQFDAKARKC